MDRSKSNQQQKVPETQDKQSYEGINQPKGNKDQADPKKGERQHHQQQQDKSQMDQQRKK
jgi:hypothetical protein